MKAIPGDLCLPLIGTAWTYLPFIATRNRFQSYMRKYLKYGKIVRERVGGQNIVSVYDPEDFKVVFQNEGRWPTRMSHEILLAVRRSFPDLYKTGGLVPTNGEEWGKLRASYQVDINKPHLVSQYLPTLEETTREFVEYIGSQSDHEGNIPDLLFKMHEWALETVCLTVLDTRLDKFGPRRKEICRELIDGANELLAALGRAENSLLWRLFKTSAYRTVAKLDVVFYRFAEKKVMQKLDEIRSNLPREEANSSKPVESVLEKYLRNPANDIKDVITMASDLINTGLLTTAITASFALYHLARNPVAQERLHEEICRILPTWSTPLNTAYFEGCHYMKACVKETLRLNPVALGNGRVLPKDVQLSGYNVPAGTIIITQNQVASVLPAYVDDPLEFKPERWFRDVPGTSRPHPYLALPFGSGPRSCIGRRFAELEMYTFLSLFIKKYRIEWTNTRKVDVEFRLLNVPVSPFFVKATTRLV